MKATTWSSVVEKAPRNNTATSRSDAQRRALSEYATQRMHGRHEVRGQGVHAAKRRMAPDLLVLAKRRVKCDTVP